MCVCVVCVGVCVCACTYMYICIYQMVPGTRYSLVRVFPPTLAVRGAKPQKQRSSYFGHAGSPRSVFAHEFTRSRTVTLLYCTHTRLIMA